MIAEPIWEPMEHTGTGPPASFGHTLAQISKTRILLFGGATSDPGDYKMTNNTYTFNLFKSTWSVLNGTYWLR